MRAFDLILATEPDALDVALHVGSDEPVCGTFSTGPFARTAVFARTAHSFATVRKTSFGLTRSARALSLAPALMGERFMSMD